MNRPKFGKVQSKMKISDTIDATRTKTYKDDALVDDRMAFEERFRVANLQEAERKVAELGRRVAADESILDPGWRYEGKSFQKVRGYFDVIFSYSAIVGKTSRK